VSPRAAVTIFFALDGFAVASFFARLPSIQDRLELSNGRIGLALLALTVTLLMAQPLAGAIASRRGSAPLVTAGALMVSAAIVAPAFAGSFGLLVLSTAAIGDWSAIHLAETLGASDATAVAGLAAFSATMTIGRLFGDRVTRRLGNVVHLRWGALVAAAGVIVAATAPTVAVAVAGFAFAGIGLSALFPLMVRAASDRAGATPGPAIAAVSTAGYGGLVTGPPLVGFLAEATSLRLALAAVLGLLCLTAAGLASTAR